MEKRNKANALLINKDDSVWREARSASSAPSRLTDKHFLCDDVNCGYTEELMTYQYCPDLSELGQNSARHSSVRFMIDSKQTSRYEENSVDTIVVCVRVPEDVHISL